MLKLLSVKDINLFKRSFKYAIPYKLKLVLTFFCIIFSIIFGLVQPLIWGKLLTKLFSREFSGLIIFIIYLTILFILESLVNFLKSYLFFSVSENIVYDLKRDMYNKMLNLPIKVFDDMKIGEFISRINGDASIVANIITNQFVNILIDIIKVIIIGVVSFKINAKLALVVLITFPITYLVFTIFGKIIRKNSSELAKINDNYFSYIQQSIFGIRDIISLGIKKNIFQNFSILSENFKNKNIYINTINNFAQAISQITSFLSQIIIISLGGYFVYKNYLTIDYFIAFSSYSIQFSNSLTNITKLNTNIQQALTSLERIFSLMDNFYYQQEKYGSLNIDKIDGEICFENVSFGYDNNESILHNISLKIPRNKKIVIVGSNGSGKTTLFNLLLQFYKPLEGCIFIDGIDIKEYSEESIRKHISVIRQEPFLFNITIKENLCAFDLSLTMDEVIKVCNDVYIHDFIENLPNGYDTLIGENGVNFSGGQKQKIAIARALLKKSKIILFDEPTSSLDNNSQSKIMEILNSISKNHTVIIITHNFSSIINDDEVIILNDGKLVGQGKHNFLISNNNFYKYLFNKELNVIDKI